MSEVPDLKESKYITIISDRKKIVLGISTILYVIMINKVAEIHVSGGNIYETRMTISQLEEKLGEGFIKAHRGCLVSVIAIHEITDKINLNNGESLIYTTRKKNQILEQFLLKQKSIINSFIKDGIPTTEEEYRKHYSSFENLPFAFEGAQFPIFIGELSIYVERFTMFSSSAGAYTAIGFIVEPGWRLLCVARFKILASSFSPLPPTIALRWPVVGSVTIIADCSILSPDAAGKFLEFS